MERKDYNKKPRYNQKPRFDKRKQDDKNKKEVGDRVVYTTKTEGPEKLADWQLKLRAISDCFDKQDREDYKELVEARYQELLHKNK